MSSHEDQSADFLVEPLTRRERERCCEWLRVATSSVRAHIKHIYDKLGVNSKRPAVKRARDLGLLKPDPHVPQIFPSKPSMDPGISNCQDRRDPFRVESVLACEHSRPLYELRLMV